MPNEKWQERVARAQQMAAERLGVDVSVMQPPRQPGGATPESEAAPADAAPAQTVAEPANVETSAPAPAEAAARPAASAAAAERVAQAKARAAARTGSANGGAAAAPARSVSSPAVVRAPAAVPAAEPEEEAGVEGINRREFLSYAWGAALGLVTAQLGLGTYQFMYPRFRAGEFGGQFPLGAASALPPTEVPPDGRTAGKFWLVNTEEGPKALYMVCTHLGCLYKWAPENSRFECPCHGSKFDREGYYIEGPAPRSLDQFLVEVVENGQVVAATEATETDIVPPPVPSPDAQIVVDTGKRIVGPSKEFSPARASADS